MTLLLLSIALASNRLDRPTSVSGIVGWPGGLGVDVAHNFSEVFGIQGQAMSWIAFTDLGFRLRGYPVGGQHWALVTSGGLHVLFAPILFAPGALEAEVGVGTEYRGDRGFLFGLDLGPALWVTDPKRTEGGDGPLSLTFFGQLRLGYAW